MKRFLAGCIASVALGTGLGAGVAPASAASSAPTAARVFVFSVPTLRYADIRADEMPALSAFLKRAAVGNLSLRVDGTTTPLAEGYATIAAGTRTIGARTEAGWAFNADEPLGSGTAGEDFTRRTGTPADGALVYLSQPALERANADELFGTEIGALGATLSASGRPRAVIANADIPERSGPGRYDRVAQTALADPEGRVPGGRLNPTLLAEDPQAPFGVRLEPAIVRDVFSRSFQPGSVVLAEASDLVRADQLPASDSDRSAKAVYARRVSDLVFASLLQQVDPVRDLVLVVGPTHPRAGPALTVAAMAGPGIEPGLLESATTRRAGVVQLVDIAPTVLARLGVNAPSSMEGRPITVGSGGGTVASRLSHLISMNDASVFRDRVIGPVTAAWIIAQVLLCAAAVVAFATRWGSRLRLGLAPVALFLLGIPFALFAARLVPFEDIGALGYAVFVVGVAAALAAVALMTARRAPFDPLIVALGALVALLVVDVATGAVLQFNSAFGYSATIGGRYAGLGNLAYSVLGASALFLAMLLAGRIGGRRGWWVAAILLVTVSAVDGLPFLGADVGGMLSLVPASAVLLWLLAGRRIKAWVVALCALGGAAVVVAVGFLDLARPADQRTHLGRLFERIGDQGWHGFWIILQRKADANLRLLTLSIWTLLIPVLFFLLAYLLYRSPGRLRVVRNAIPEFGPTLVAFGVLAVLGFALNDSGIAIPGVMLGIANAVIVFLAARVPEPEIDSIEPAQVAEPV